MQKVRTKAKKFVSGLMLLALVFGLGASVVPNVAKAATGDIHVDFRYQASQTMETYSQGYPVVIRFTDDTNQNDVSHGAMTINYEFVMDQSPAGQINADPMNDFVFNNAPSTTVGTITVPAGSGDISVNLIPVNDSLNEGNEFVRIRITSVTSSSGENLFIGTQGTFYFDIYDDDDNTQKRVGFVNGAAGIQEGNGFTVSLNFFDEDFLDLSHGDVQIDYEVAVSSTADANTDFVFNNTPSTTLGTIIIPAGIGEVDLPFQTVQDTMVEGDERAIITITDVRHSGPEVFEVVPNGRTIALTIIDNDGVKELSLQTATNGVVESDGLNRGFRAYLNYASFQSVSFQWRIAGGTATQGVGADFTAGSSTAWTTVTIPSLLNFADVNLGILNDNIDEANETINIEIANPTNAVLGPITSQVFTIYDDDTSVISFASSSSVVSENVTSLAIPVVLSRPNDRTVTVEVGVDLPNSTAGQDDHNYASSTLSLTFAPGETSKNVELVLTDDALVELNEVLRLYIMDLPVGGNGEIVSGDARRHAVTILDDENHDPIHAGFEVETASAEEGSGVSVKLISDALALGKISAHYIISGSANSSDFTFNGSTSTTGMLEIPFGSTSTVFQLLTTEDVGVEGNETVVISIDVSSVDPRVLPSSSTVYTFTILDDDAVVTPPVSGGGSSGGSSGGGSAIPTVILGSGAFEGENLSVKVDSLTTVGDMTFANLVLVGGTATRMSISNNASFENAVQEAYKTTAMWKLPSAAGEKKIFVKFFNNAGTASVVVSTTVDTAGNPGGQVLGVKTTLLDELIAELKPGTISDEVRQLQVELQKAGFFAKTFKPTRLYGTMTKAAVAKYVASKNAVVLSFDELVNTLTVGSRGANVARLQTELKKRGFFPASIAVTMYYGPMTKAAVAKYLASK